MVDPIDVPALLKVLTLTLDALKIVGVPGIVALMFLYPTLVTVLWVTHERQVRKILTRYKEDVDKVKTMYERNVSLVQKYETIAGSLMDVVKMNTQAITRLDERLGGRVKV
jgi:hypothetical protein